MGNSQSNLKKESEPVVLYPPSNATLSVSPDLVNQLSGQPNKRNNNSQELDSDQLERLVQERAQQEIERIQLEDEKIKQHLSNKNLADTQILSEYLEDLVKKNTRQPIAQANTKVDDAKDALIVCYNNKPKRPLDCWQEVLNFKESIALAQKEFVNSQL